MRFHRSKLTRKYLKFYRIVFGINEPYDVLLDGNFIFSCLKYKVDLRDRLARLLQVQENQVRLYVTRSVIEELQLAGNKASDVLEFAQKFCVVIEDGGASNSKMPTVNRLLTTLESHNKRKYIIASQDKELRVAISKIPGIPTIYFNKVIMLMESPSETSKRFHMKKESSKDINDMKLMNVGEFNDTIKSSDKIINETNISATNPVLRRKAKAKAANPLSSLPSNQESRTTKKRKKEKYRK